MAHRMGFRKVKDPYGMSVLETNVNESEEKIINKDPEQAAGGATLENSKTRRMSTRPIEKDAIHVTQEVNVSSIYSDQAQPPNWRFE
jgi:hypothetical protein